MANWLDKSIAWISPQAGMQRLRARAALSVMRNYEAANSGTRKTTAWQTAGGSGTSVAASAVSRVRNNARELVRNNPYAFRAIDILTAKSVGTGIRARFASKQVDKVFKAWAKTCDYDGQLDLYGIQSLAARAQFEGGEVLVRRVWTRGGDGVPLRLQILEPDYIDSTKWGKVGDNLIIAGIEIDKTGRRVAYWLYDAHPGETNGLFPASTLQSKRHDAIDILHFYEKRRAGQMRAVSRLAASVMKLRSLDEYQEAEIVRKKIEACFVAFVHGGSSSMPLGEAVTDPTTGLREETVSPGLINYLKQGESVSFGAPAASDGYAEYTTAELHAIAVGAGVTYEQLTGDLRGVNLSSIRSGMQDFRDLVDSWRWIYFVPMVCQRFEAWFLEAAWTANKIRTREVEAIWTAPRWPYMQPVDDIKALKEEIRGGLTSTSAAIRERGEDPIEVYDEIAGERKDWKAKGVAIDTDPAVAAAAKAVAPGPADESSSSAADDDEDAKKKEKPGEIE